MKFLLQKVDKDDTVEMDIHIVESVLRNGYRNQIYTFCSIEDLEKFEKIEEYIPIGSLQFVGKWLNICKGIENINPIEVPKILRTTEFLKREYNIVPFEDIPRKGYFFLKDISVLKTFSYLGMMENFDFESIDKSHLYQVSSVLDVRSEYRVYFINGQIEAIEQYNGLALDICDPRYIIDRGLLIKANALYQLQKDYPKSYTMDIMVGDFGTAICEIHPFISVGLYSTLWGMNLLSAYKDGIDYVLKYNTKVNNSDD